jgi:hypothetical protein
LGCGILVRSQPLIGEEFSINTDSHGLHKDPEVTKLHNGGFVVVWENMVQSSDNYDIYARMYDANGTTYWNEFRINTYTTGIQQNPKITTLKCGYFVIVWESSAQDGSDYGIFAQMYMENGASYGSEFQVNTYTNNKQLAPSISALNDGKFIITWESYKQTNLYDIYAQMYHNNGAVYGSEFRVNQYTTHDQRQSAVAPLSNGRFIIMWSSDRQERYSWNLYAQIYDANGSVYGDSFRVNKRLSDDNHRTPTAISINNRFVITWSCGFITYSICSKIYDIEGSVIVNDFLISTDGTSSSSDTPSMILWDHDKFMVAWEGTFYDTVNVAVLTINGTIYNTIENVPSINVGMQGHPAISVLDDGHFVVVWTSSNDVSWDIKAKICSVQPIIKTNHMNINTTSIYSLNYITKDKLFVANGCGNNDPSLLYIVEFTQHCHFETWGYNAIYGYNEHISPANNFTQRQIDLDFVLFVLEDLFDDGYLHAHYKIRVVDEMSSTSVVDSNIIFDGNQNTDFSSSISESTDVAVSPSVRTFALLSLKVYYDPKDSHYPWPTDWYPILTSFDNLPENTKSQGFFAGAYYNNKTQTLIIAFRGTDDKWDVFMNDLAMVANTIPRQYYAAEKFVSYVYSHMTSAGLTVQYRYFTGHSLGASLAELCAAKFKVRATTFDSPGTKSLIDQTELDFLNNNVNIFNTAPNLVNTMARHAGIVYRIYPLIDGFTKVKVIQPDDVFYAQVYTFGGKYFALFGESAGKGQHSMSGIVDQLNDKTDFKVKSMANDWPSGMFIGCNGYDYYKDYQLNPYYWDNHLKSFSSNPWAYMSLSTAIKIGKDALEILMKKTSLIVTLLDTFSASCQKIGANISGDDSGNIIWGTTNYADTITTGFGADTIYFHNGDDTSYDQGGYDTYIVPIKINGIKTIKDVGNYGAIYIGSEKLYSVSGLYPVTETACPTITNESYVFIMDKLGAYYVNKRHNNLIITVGCENVKNMIILEDADWGDFATYKHDGRDQVVIVGSNDNDVIDCSLHCDVRTCYAESFKGHDTLIANSVQNAILIGSDVGVKRFKILHNVVSRRSVTDQHEIRIQGIKTGDIIDLSAFNDSQTFVIQQNGTDSYIDLGQGVIIHAQINLGSPFIFFNQTNTTMLIPVSLDMSPYFDLSNYTKMQKNVSSDQQEQDTIHDSNLSSQEYGSSRSHEANSSTKTQWKTIGCIIGGIIFILVAIITCCLCWKCR